MRTAGLFFGVLLSVLFTFCKSSKVQPAVSPAGNAYEYSRNLLEAQSALMAGNTSECERLLEVCVKGSPDRPEAYFYYSKLKLRQRQTEKALDLARRAAQLDPQESWYQENLAEVLAFSGNAASAAQIMEKAAAPSGKPQWQRSFQATDWYVAAGDYDGAYRMLDKTEQRYGLREEIIFYRENLLQSQSKYREAAAQVRKLAEKYPNRINYLEKLALDLQMAGDLDECRKVLLAIIAKDSLHPGAWLGLADISARTRDSATEWKAMNTALSQPAIPAADAEKTLGGFRMRYPTAISDGRLRKLAQIYCYTHPQDKLGTYMLADVLSAMGGYSQALHLYVFAAGDGSGLKTDGYRKLIECALEAGAGDTARMYADQANEFYFTQYQVKLMLAAAYMPVSADKAGEYLKQAYSFAGNNEDAQLRCRLAEVRLFMADTVRCSPLLKEIAAKAPALPEYQLLRARFLLNSGYPTDVISWLKSISLPADQAEFRAILAESYFRNSDVDAALAAVGEAMRLQPLNWKWNLRCGDYLMAAGKKDKAAEMWKLSVANGARGTELAKIKEKLAAAGIRP